MPILKPITKKKNPVTQSTTKQKPILFDWVNANSDISPKTNAKKNNNNKSKQLWFQLSPSWVWEVREFGRINQSGFEQRERKSVGIEGVTSSRPSPGRRWLKHWMFGHGGMIRSSWEMISFTWVLGLFKLFFSWRKCIFSPYILDIFLFWPLHFHFSTFSP